MARNRTRNIDDLLNKLEAQEDAFLKQQFLAPAISGGTVRVRIAGAVCDIQIEPADYRGWGIFAPVTHQRATRKRDATLKEKREYLNLFPQVRLVVCRRIGQEWFGSMASFGDTRLQLNGIASIALGTEIELFDTIRVRYDGKLFWFEEVDTRSNPRVPVYLRESFENRVEPAELKFKGLTAEQRAAYELCFWELTGREQPSDLNQGSESQSNANESSGLAGDLMRLRLRESLSHAGARLVSYAERGDSCRVTFAVDGESYTSAVNKDDLSLQVAGICLDGEDQKFDLSSLVGVLREGQATGQIYPEW